MQAEQPLVPVTHQTPDARQTPIVEAKHLEVRRAGRTVLRDVNFALQPGEFVGCIGPNGAGKSTLLRVLLGLLSPTSGQVSLFGRPLHRGNRHVGYVPQQSSFSESMSLRARDVVSLGIDGTRYGPLLPSRDKRDRVDQVLEEVRASSFADVPIARLSGGEQQRLMLAQALVGDPDLLLLDEPLANLDLRSRRDVVNLVCDVCHSRGITVLFVAHDVNPLLRAMDRVLYIANGRSVIGSVDEVVRTDVLTKLFGFPVHAIRAEGQVLVSAADEGDGCHA